MEAKIDKPLSAQIRSAVRANLLPGVALWAFAALVLLAWHAVEPTRAALGSVAAFREGWGFSFAMASTAFFGGLLPFLLQKANARLRAEARWRDLPFYLIFWAVKGVEVDLLYQLQVRLFGTDVEKGTIIVKTLLDQFVYVPLWAAPTMTLAYWWKSEGYSLARLRGRMGRGWYRRMIFPVMAANWMVWIPAVAVIYSLPLPLQLPIQNLTLSFFVLIVLFMTRPKAL